MNIVALAGEVVGVGDGTLTIRTSTDTGRVDTVVNHESQTTWRVGDYVVVIGEVRYKWTIADGFQGKLTEVAALRVVAYNKKMGVTPYDILGALSVI